MTKLFSTFLVLALWSGISYARTLTAPAPAPELAPDIEQAIAVVSCLFVHPHGHGASYVLLDLPHDLLARCCPAERDAYAGRAQRLPRAAPCASSEVERTGALRRTTPACAVAAAACRPGVALQAAKQRRLYLRERGRAV